MIPIAFSHASAPGPRPGAAPLLRKRLRMNLLFPALKTGFKAGVGRLAVFLLLSSAAGARADLTRYGFSGVNFVPDAEKSFGPDLAYGYFLPVKEEGRDGAYPAGFCVLASLTVLPLEIGLSNTALLASGTWSDGYDPRTVHDFLPVLPSVKYALREEHAAWGDWQMAAGFAMPYGAYFASGFKARLFFLEPQVTAGISSRYSAYHIFGGLELRFLGRNRAPLPLYLTGDGAFGNSLERLDRSEERFFSVGIRMDAGQHLQLGMTYRRDGIYKSDDVAETLHQNPGLVAFQVVGFFNPLSRRNTP